MTSSAAPEGKAEVAAIGISFQVKLDPDKTLVLQTGIAADSTVADLNAMLDKMANATQRMEKRFLIPAVEKSIEVCEREMLRAQKGLQELDLAFSTKQEIFAKDKKRGEAPGEDRRTGERRIALKVAIDEFSDKIKVYTADLAELKKEAFGDGADVGTDLRTSA